MYEVEVRAEPVLDRCDPEYAELGNPRGEVYRQSWYVQVTHESGRRWVSGDWEEEAAKHEAELIRLAIDCGLRLDDFVDGWHETDPAYGSQEYIDGDYERLNAIREREDEMMGL
jgi:hypothetical protein